MRVKTIILNGRDSQLSFPSMKEAHFKGEKICSLLIKEIRLKGVSLNFCTENLFKNVEKVTITETRQNQASCVDILSKVQQITTDDSEVLAYAV